MPTLNIRIIPDDIYSKLCLRAAKAGRSVEAEVKELIAAAVERDDDYLEPSQVQDLMDAFFGGQKPTGVVDALIRERRREAASE